MAGNVFQNSALISKTLAILVENNLVMGRLAMKQFKNEIINQKIGGTIQYDKPVKFLVNDGADITSTIQDIHEATGTINVNQRKHVAFKVTAQDLTLSVDKITEKYLAPAAIQLANKIDSAGTDLYKDVYNTSGTPGTTPGNFAAIAGPAKKLTKFAVPNRDRYLVVDPDAQYEIPTGLQSILQENIVGGIIKEAKVGRVAAFDIFGDQNIKTHTAGDWAGTVLVAGAAQSGASINLDGFTNSGVAQLKKGDIISFAAVNAVNPVSRLDNGDISQHVLTADATVTAGAATVLLDPPLSVTGADQTVTALPGDNAAVTEIATHQANIAFNKAAFQLVTVPIVVPEDATGNFFVHNGIGIRYLRVFDGLKDEQVYRLDVLFGWKTQYPEFACRLLG